MSILSLRIAIRLPAQGDVARLLTSLATQPVHIRGGVLVDPLELVSDLSARTAAITQAMAHALQAVGEERGGAHARFLDSCFRL